MDSKDQSPGLRAHLSGPSLPVTLIGWLCMDKHVEVKAQLVGVASLLPLCGFWDGTQIVRLSGLVANSHLINP